MTKHNSHVLGWGLIRGVQFEDLRDLSNENDELVIEGYKNIKENQRTMSSISRQIYQLASGNVFQK